VTPMRASCDRRRQRARVRRIVTVDRRALGPRPGARHLPTPGSPRPHPLGARLGAVVGISGPWVALGDIATPARL